MRCNTCGQVIGSTRSNKQSNYYWGVVIDLIADHTGDSPEATHRTLKEMFLPRMFVTVGDEEREADKTTTLLTTGQMEDYLMRVRVWAGQELGVVIPLPNEAPLSP